jgi:hypothetical protein
MVLDIPNDIDEDVVNIWVGKSEVLDDTYVDGIYLVFVKDKDNLHRVLRFFYMAGTTHCNVDYTEGQTQLTPEDIFNLIRRTL